MKTPNGMTYSDQKESFLKKKKKLPKTKQCLCQRKQLKKSKETVRSTIILCSQHVQHLFLENKDISELDLDELDELEDSEDEAVLLQYRQKRIAEIKALAEKSKFGSVIEISGQDYVSEVNKAGEGIWVILHLYKQG